MLATVLGLFVAWKRECTSGLLILGGFAFFAVAKHEVRFNALIQATLAVGSLYLVCGWLRRRKLGRVTGLSV